MQAYGVFAGSVRRQATVYAGLRRVQAADIVGHHRRRSRRRNLRAYVRAQIGARCAGVHTHKFQKPETRLAAVVPRCAGVRIHNCRPRCMTAAGEALCRLTACEIRRYRCRRRALSLACGGAKGGAVSQTCIHKRTLSLGKQTAARAGGGRKQTLSVVTGDDLDGIAHLRADGRLHTQAWCANGCRPQCATAADEPPRRSTGV